MRPAAGGPCGQGWVGVRWRRYRRMPCPTPKSPPPTPVDDRGTGLRRRGHATSSPTTSTSPATSGRTSSRTTTAAGCPGYLYLDGGGRAARDLAGHAGRRRRCWSTAGSWWRAVLLAVIGAYSLAAGLEPRRRRARRPGRTPARWSASPSATPRRRWAGGAAQPTDLADPRLLGREPAQAAGPRAGRRRRRRGRRRGSSRRTPRTGPTSTAASAPTTADPPHSGFSRTRAGLLV